MAKILLFSLLLQSCHSTKKLNATTDSVSGINSSSNEASGSPVAVGTLPAQHARNGTSPIPNARHAPKRNVAHVQENNRGTVHLNPSSNRNKRTKHEGSGATPTPAVNGHTAVSPSLAHKQNTIEAQLAQLNRSLLQVDANAPHVPQLRMQKKQLEKQLANIISQKMQKDLQARYMNDNFVWLPSLFPGEAPQHVQKLACTLQLIRHTDKSATQADARNDVSTHYERSTKTNTVIKLKDLFQRRSMKSGEGPRDVHRILIVGNPGTGKTTLSKQIAYHWAKGDWGQEFEAVYVLPVRALSKNQYDDINYRREANLSTAIINNCFIPPAEETAYKELKQQIEHKLKQATTLIVLDGLDERAGANENLLSQAKDGAHKLLMLSRTYNIEQERKLADIEVEHTGLSDAQMYTYINNNLSNEQSKTFQSFISQTVSIKEIAHVPVNLQILCFLWKDQQEQDNLRYSVRHGSLPGLYRMLTRYTWKRYIHRVQNLGTAIEKRDSVCDMLGELAFRALKEGKLFINTELLDDLVEEHSIRGVEDIQETGLLILLRESSQYQFPHLTFQEYFAGTWLAKQLFSSEEKMRDIAQNFLRDHRHMPQYKRMLSFAAGEICQEKSWEGITHFLSICNDMYQQDTQSSMADDEETSKLVAMHHLFLQLRILNEALCISAPPLQDGLADLEQKFQVFDLLTTCLSNAVVTMQSGKGTHVLSRLIEMLQEFRILGGHIAACITPLATASKQHPDAYVRWITTTVLGKLVPIMPQYAAQYFELFQQILKDSDEYVRLAAVPSLAATAKAKPELALKCFEMLLSFCKDQSPLVCRVAVKAMTEVAALDSQLATRCFELLLDICQYIGAHKQLHEAVYDSISALINKVPLLAEKYLKIVEQACKSPHSAIRRAATLSLVGIAKVDSKLAIQCFNVLSPACIDAHIDVREATYSTFGVIAQISPELVAQCCHTLLHACQDAEERVRKASLRSLEVIAKIFPEKVFELLSVHNFSQCNSFIRRALTAVSIIIVQSSPQIASQCLQTIVLVACQDPDEYVRESAQRAVAAIARTVPQHASQCLNILRVSCQDQHSAAVRYAAVRSFVTIIKVAPEFVDQCFSVLSVVGKDAHPEVRKAVSSVLESITQIVPASALPCFEILLTACMDTDINVRRASVESLVTVAKLIPDEALSTLITSCSHQDTHISHMSREVLMELAKSIPTQALVSLLAACALENQNIRRAATEALVSVSKIIPEQVYQYLFANSALSNVHVYAQRAAAEVLVTLAGITPRLASHCLPSILTACSNQDEFVRQVGYNALRPVIQAIPEQVTQCFHATITAYSDSHPAVRYAAIESSIMAVKALPVLGTQCFKPLLVAVFRDADANVRNMARSSFVTVTKLVPSEALKFLLLSCQDQDASVRGISVEYLVAVGQADCTLLSQCFTPLISIACKDSDESVRKVAGVSLTALIQGMPTGDAMELLVAACRDQDISIREMARDYLINIVQATDSIPGSIFNKLLVACNDPDASVRAFNMQIVSKVKSKRVEEII